VSDQDLLVGDEDALHYQPQYLLLELEGRARQPRADPLAELRDGLLKCRCSFGLYLLSLQHLLSLVKLFARLPQPPSALFELIELDGPSLVGIDQALLFPLQCRPPIAHSLQLPLRICCLRPFPFLLLSHIAYDMTSGRPSNRATCSHTSGSMSLWLTERRWHRLSGGSAARRRVHS
jgi:hypothetical protein